MQLRSRFISVTLQAKLDTAIEYLKHTYPILNGKLKKYSSS